MKSESDIRIELSISEANKMDFDVYSMTSSKLTITIYWKEKMYLIEKLFMF